MSSRDRHSTSPTSDQDRILAEPDQGACDHGRSHLRLCVSAAYACAGGGAMEPEHPHREHPDGAGCSASRQRPGVSAAGQARHLLQGADTEGKAGLLEEFVSHREAESADAELQNLFQWRAPADDAGLCRLGQLPRLERRLAGDRQTLWSRPGWLTTPTRTRPTATPSTCPPTSPPHRSGSCSVRAG